MVFFRSFTCRVLDEPPPPPPRDPPKRPCPVPVKNSSPARAANADSVSQQYWASHISWLNNYLSSEACAGGTFDAFLKLEILQPFLADFDTMVERIEQSEFKELSIEEIAKIGETHGRLFALVSDVLRLGRTLPDLTATPCVSAEHSSLLSAEDSLSYVNKLFRAFLKAIGEIYISCHSGELASADRQHFGRHHVLLAYDVLQEIWETYQSYVNHLLTITPDSGSA